MHADTDHHPLIPAPPRRALRRLAWGLAAAAGALVVLSAALGAGESLETVIGIFSTRFLGIFIEAAPFLLLGTVVSGVIDSFLTPDDIARLVPRNPFLATVTGAFMGFAFPVCECGVVPVVRRLFGKGLPMSVGVTFLLAAPVMNPIVVASTFTAFGWGPIFIGRFVITAVVAIGAGLVFALGARPQDVLLPRGLVPAAGGSGSALPVYRRPALGAGLLRALGIAADEFFEMGRYLVIGSMLAAGMQTLVAQDVLLALGTGPVTSVIVMQIMAFVLSVCSTVDAFLALAFVGTFTAGSILAFLTFGPMVDIKSTMMFLGVFQRRVVAYLILLPLLMTLLIGVWINLNLPL